MGGFHSDLENLSARAGEFADHAERAKRVATSLRQVIESAGACWGEDEIGRRFAAAHHAPADAALASVEEIPGRLLEMGEGLAATADTTRAADLSNADQLGRLTEER